MSTQIDTYKQIQSNLQAKRTAVPEYQLPESVTGIPVTQPNTVTTPEQQSVQPVVQTPVAPEMPVAPAPVDPETPAPTPAPVAKQPAQVMSATIEKTPEQKLFTTTQTNLSKYLTGKDLYTAVQG